MGGEAAAFPWRAIALTCLPFAWWLQGHQAGQADTPEAGPISAQNLADVGVTLKELRTYDGQGNGSIFIALWGRVFNVTAGSEHYAPGQGYHSFAGHDCTHAFAITKEKKKFLDLSLDGLTEKQFEHLNETYWGTYMKKYSLIGVLEDPPYNPVEYDAYAGPFADARRQAVENRRALIASGNASAPVRQRESRCPVKRAARIAAEAIAEFLPRLMLYAPGASSAPETSADVDEGETEDEEEYEADDEEEKEEERDMPTQTADTAVE